MATLSRFFFFSFKNGNERTKCLQIKFSGYKEALNPCKSSFVFLVPTSHPQQIPTRHWRIKNITPQKQNQGHSAKDVEPWEPQIMALEEGWGEGWLEALVASTLHWSLKAKNLGLGI